jgi:hypothetical protein
VIQLRQLIQSGLQALLHLAGQQDRRQDRQAQQGQPIRQDRSDQLAQLVQRHLGRQRRPEAQQRLVDLEALRGLPPVPASPWPPEGLVHRPDRGCLANLERLSGRQDQQGQSVREDRRDYPADPADLQDLWGLVNQLGLRHRKRLAHLDRL